MQHDQTATEHATILRAAIEAKGCTIAQLVLVSDVSRSAIFRILRGAPTTRRTRRDVALAVGLAPDALSLPGELDQ